MKLLISTAHQARVQMFMKAAGQDVAPSPALPASHVLRLRAELVLEEALETLDALGFVLESPCLIKHGEPDLVGIVDGCLDLSVVSQGTLLSCGVIDEPLQREVDENNYLKVSRCQISPSGKILKAKDHPEPRIRELLIEQGWNP